MENGDAVAEAQPEAAERLRRERDLRNEHDRAASARKRGLARAHIDLRLAASGRAVQKDVAAAAVEQLADPLQRTLLLRRDAFRRRLRLERAGDRRVPHLPAPLRRVRG